NPTFPPLLAPVNAPSSYPKSSDSIRAGDKDPQSTFIKGLDFLLLFSCIYLLSIPLPTPDSPSINILESTLPIRKARCFISSIFLFLGVISPYISFIFFISLDIFILILFASLILSCIFLIFVFFSLFLSYFIFVFYIYID